MKLKIFVIGLLLVMIASVAMADKDSYKSHLGYVDFEYFMKISGEPKVEVFLKEPMLNLARKFLENEDEELAKMLGKLKLVRVQVFDVDKQLQEEASEAIRKTSKELISKGWERIVKIRDDGQMVDVFVRPSEDYDYLNGIVVMVVEEDGEAVFVNIVGEINPEDIGKLAHHFDIDELDEIREELEKSQRRRRHHDDD